MKWKWFMRIVLAVIFLISGGANLPSAYAERTGAVRRVWHGQNVVHHGAHARVGVFVGPGWWWPGWWEPYPYYPYYPYYQTPPVIVEQPTELYVQPNSQEQAPVYWYFCRDPQGYYPYVSRCPKGWMKVVPPANPPK